jgi:hypothetical protein
LVANAIRIKQLYLFFLTNIKSELVIFFWFHLNNWVLVIKDKRYTQDGYNLVFHMKVSRLKYRWLHRIFCRICSVALFFVEFTFWQVFYKLFGIKFRIFGAYFYYPKSTLHPKVSQGQSIAHNISLCSNREPDSLRVFVFITSQITLFFESINEMRDEMPLSFQL